MKNKIDSKRFRYLIDSLGFSIPDLAKAIKMSPQLLNYKIGNKVLKITTDFFLSTNSSL